MNQVLKEFNLNPSQQVQIVQGDITEEAVDAIVNAANAHLQHAAGVAGAISCKGGATIQQESYTWITAHGVVSHEQPAWTSAGSLKAKFVIHAVGPVWGEGNEDEKLRLAVTGSLRLADQLDCSSISLPAISTGIFGFPRERAARIIVNAIESYLSLNENSNLTLVRLILFDPDTVAEFLKVFDNPS